MQKFAICIIKGNDIKIVSTHLTLEEAVSNGEIVNKQLPGDAGTLSCLSGIIIDNQFVDNKTKIHKVWI